MVARHSLLATVFVLNRCVTNSRKFDGSKPQVLIPSQLLWLRSLGAALRGLLPWGSQAASEVSPGLRSHLGSGASQAPVVEDAELLPACFCKASEAAALPLQSLFGGGLAPFFKSSPR